MRRNRSASSTDRAERRTRGVVQRLQVGQSRDNPGLLQHRAERRRDARGGAAVRLGVRSGVCVRRLPGVEVCQVLEPDRTPPAAKIDPRFLLRYRLRLHYIYKLRLHYIHTSQDDIMYTQSQDDKITTTDRSSDILMDLSGSIKRLSPPTEEFSCPPRAQCESHTSRTDNQQLGSPCWSCPCSSCPSPSCPSPSRSAPSYRPS